jgi:outer membrane biosynthesis protein TonB
MRWVVGLVIIPDDTQSRRGTFKFCLDVTGKVGDIEQLQSTGDGRYDAKIERKMQQWAFRPVIVDNQPTAVCSYITFNRSHR